mmetsp:Transcript_9169/g.14226  ORF Transcript_9169/g.14226 Transcript_9169/m.14226 type:complete len:222 (-) Transcript_9169:1674-2339(-)
MTRHNLWHCIVVFFLFHFVSSLLTHSLTFQVSFDFFSDGEFTCALANFCKISTSELVCLGCKVCQVNFFRYRGLSQSSTQNSQTTLVVRHRDVDQLIETSRTHEGSVNNVRPICSSNDKHILLCTDTVHFSQKLIHYTIGCTTTVSRMPSALLSDRIQLIKEKYTWSCLTCFFEHVADVCFTFSEPHSQQLRSLHGNEIGLAFIGNSLGHQSLTASRRTIE